MSQQSFIPRARICVCCGAKCLERSREPGRPTLITIALCIYRRGAGKKQFKYGGSVQICEPCLIHALSGGGLFEGGEGRKFVAALRESITGRYNLMLDQDNAPADLLKPEKSLFRQLFKESA